MRPAINKALFVIVALILSGALWRTLSSGGGNVLDGDPRTETALAAIYLMVGVLAAIRLRETLKSLWRNPALAALLLLACISPLWAESPDVVLRRAVALVGTSLFGITLATRYSFEEQLRIYRWALRLGATATIALLVVSPGRALSAADGGGGIRGVFPHKNILGTAMAMGFLVDWYLREAQGWKKTLRLVSLCIYTVLLAASDSMAAIVTVIAAMIAVWAFQVLCRRHGVPALALSLFLAVGVGAVTVAGIAPGDFISLLGRSSDLTGRTELWSAVSDAIHERPWLGYGFSGFWKGASSLSENVQLRIGWSPTYSHNGYLEIALSLGLVGLFFAVCMLATGFRRAWRQAGESDSSLDGWPLAFLLFVVIHNLAECSIAWQNCLEWSVCVAAVIRCDQRFSPALVDDREEAEEPLEESLSSVEAEYV